MSDLISVVTGFYNRGSFVKSSIGSLLSQTYENIEIIVFDDNSTDNTYDELLKIEDKRLKIIHHQTNIGFVSGLINAINQTAGKYIAIHGSGDISHPDRLKKQYDILSSNDEIGVIGCNILNFTQETNGQIIKTVKKCVADKQSKYEIIHGTNCFSHGEVMMKRKYYDIAGGYRKAFYYSQDRDLWLRLIDICKFAVVDEILYERIYIPNSLRFDIKKVIIQKKYSELARQCAEEKDNGNKDLVDLYGVHAIGFLNKSQRLSTFYYKMFLDYLPENVDISLDCLRLAVCEKPTILMLATYYLFLFLGVNKFSKSLVSRFSIVLSLLSKIINKVKKLNYKVKKRSASYV